MSILLQNRETLTRLFSSFSLQEILLVNQNLSHSWHLLLMPPAQLMAAMNEKQVSIEHFLGKKCLPLIRFYIADSQMQKQVFLSKTLLESLFTSLPAVEAMVFKGQIQSAQASVQLTNQALSSLLAETTQPTYIERVKPVVQITEYQTTSSFSNNNLSQKKNISQLSEADKRYLNCFYYLQAGELVIVADGSEVDADMLLYSELSPLQQLHAQKLFKLSCHKQSIESMAQQSASA